MAGDKNAYDIILHNYKDIVFFTVNSIVKNYHTAEDITQDVFIDGFLKLKTLGNPDKIGVWLLKIARNKCYNYLERSVLKNETELEDTFAETRILMPEDYLIEKYDRSVITKAIENLSDIYKDVIMMFYFRKYSRKKISEFLDIPEATVKRRLNSARKIMKKELDFMSNTTDRELPQNFEEKTSNTLSKIVTSELCALSLIYMTAPDAKEITRISEVTDIGEDYFYTALDEGKYDTFEQDGGFFVYLYTQIKHNDKYITVPLGCIFSDGNYIITMQKSESTGYVEADDIFKQAVESLWSSLSVPGYINIDFLDICTIVNMGKYLYVAAGNGKGEGKGEKAAEALLSFFPNKTILEKSKGTLASFKCSSNISLNDVDSCSNKVIENLKNDAYIIWGANFDDTLTDEINALVMVSSAEK